MITSWSVNSFKSAREETLLEFAPLTIFAGANSSGKSSIIQSMLLTAQTIQSSVTSRRIVLNGHILRLGEFRDIRTNGQPDKSVSIGFSLQLQKELSKRFKSEDRFIFANNDDELLSDIVCRYSFYAPSEAEPNDLAQLQPFLESVEIVANSVSDNTKHSQRLRVVRSQKEQESRAKELGLESNSLNPGSKLLLMEVAQEKTERLTNFSYLKEYFTANAKVAGATLNHFLPTRLVCAVDEVEQECNRFVELILSPRSYYYYKYDESKNMLKLPPRLYEKLTATILSVVKDLDIGKNERSKAIREYREYLKSDCSPEEKLQRYFRLPVSLQNIVTERMTEHRTELIKAFRNDRPSKTRLQTAPLAPILEQSVESIQNFFSRNIRYLGPLRDEPKSIYPLAGAIDPNDVGFRGEYTASVLDINKYSQVEYISGKHFSTIPIEPKIGRISLIGAVHDWLSYLGVVEEVSTTDKGKLGHELRVSTDKQNSENLHDLTHVGVGVSQVLPILVLSLLAPKHSTLIFEQPELHLHPRVQSRLADFFVSLNLLGKQCIVETHSEYIINRLRYRSAKSKGKEISDSVMIYFVEKNSGASSYKPIRINEFGVIEDWPTGFFDESEIESMEILKAAMEKRKKNLKGTSNA